MQLGVQAGASFPGTGVGTGRLRIVLVEDHVILREGLKALIDLDDDYRIVGEFNSAEQSIAGIRELQPDVVITDLGLPGRSGIDLLGEIVAISPLSHKIVLTAHENEEYIRAALSAGADGYVLKNASGADLMMAIRAVARGEQFLCRAIASKVLSGYLSGDKPTTVGNATQAITEREREVLTRIALGNSNKRIAQELGVSPKTIEKHRSNLMRKLQLHNAAAITMFAIRNGLTRSEPSAHLAPERLHKPFPPAVTA